MANLEGLVAEEQDAFKVGMCLDMLKAVGLVPSLWEDIKANLETGQQLGVPPGRSGHVSNQPDPRWKT